MTKEMENTYELAGTALSKLPADAIAEIKSDTAGFLKKIGMEGDVKASLAENNDKQVHLCLPFYSWVDEAASAASSAVEDSELHASGGLYYEGLYRLPATENWHLADLRNRHQCAHNLRMIGTSQYHRIDNSYDGDFDVDRNPTNIK